MIKDGYAQFFELISKEDFFQFGLDNLILIDPNLVKIKWKKLLQEIKSGSSELYVRNFGRNGSGNELIIDFYRDIFDLKIKFDNTTNANPKQLLQKLSGYQVNKDIFNYQISHVFGRTKNVYCFTAPWNLVFIPKILDPLTGHESKGDYVKEFQYLFKNKIYSKFKNEITEYNKIISKKQDQIFNWVDENVTQTQRKNAIINDFSEIPKPRNE